MITDLPCPALTYVNRLQAAMPEQGAGVVRWSELLAGACSGTVIAVITRYHNLLRVARPT